MDMDNTTLESLASLSCQLVMLSFVLLIQTYAVLLLYLVSFCMCKDMISI